MPFAALTTPNRSSASYASAIGLLRNYRSLAPQSEAVAKAAHVTRDRNRTPLQWSNAPNAGFSPEGAITWLPVNPNYSHVINVAEQDDNPRSMLNFYRHMLHLRKHTPELIAGDYTSVNVDVKDYLAFTRSHLGQTCLVVLNMTEQPQTARFDLTQARARCLFSTAKSEGGEFTLSDLNLAPFEIFIGELAT